MSGTTNKKKTTATKGKTSRASGTSKRQTGRKKQDESLGFIRSEIVVIVSFAVSAILLLSNFNLCGMAGRILRSVQLGVFGMIGYVAPVLLFAGIFFYMSNRGNTRAVLKLSAVMVGLLVLCGLAQLMFGDPAMAGAKVTEVYQSAAASGRGGGAVGGFLASALGAAVGRVGAYLVLFVILAICLVCITERSLVNALRNGGGKAYRYARDDMDRRREVHAERQEEKRRIREEQRIRGVNLEATKIQEAPAPEPEITGDFAGQDWPEEEGYMEASAYEEAGAAVGAGKSAGRKGSKHLGEVLDDLEELRPGAASGIEAGMPAVSAEEKQKNPADEFRGSIALGSAYDDDTVPFDTDESIKADGDGTIYAVKDTRTLREMDLMMDEAPRGPMSADGSARGVMSADGSARGVMSTDGSARGVVSADGSAHRVMSADEDVWASPDADEAPWGAPAAEDAAWASTVETLAEEGINYDSFIVPEAPKRVVTASGKVIETDTEMLQKKLETKRGEAAKKAEAESGADLVQAQLEAAEEALPKEYVYPPITLLKKGNRLNGSRSEKEYKETAIKLQQTLHNFGVGVTVTNISCGPSVTRYELYPEQGVKVSRIVGLADDIKLNLAAADIRIEAPIPGKSAVGIEVPNKENNIVFLRDILDSEEFKSHPSKIAFAVGKDIGGQAVVTDIGKMPHLLIAGATGSGKSVCINTLIMSIIYKADPEDVKMIMVDPKVVELSVYNGIPHLLIPVVTDPKKASGALNWAVAEMTDRYKKFADYSVRDLKGYNAKVEAVKEIEDEKKPKKMPQIVIIIDELADLMMVAPGEVEDAICRLAQLARAAGIHLVIATQRPSVNVITGLIKANVPSRIAFAVSSGVDSRTIIDMNGAEKLLGKGDMLFYPAGIPKPVRVQGAFISDSEVSAVVEFLTEQGMTAQYSTEVESRIAAPPAAAEPESPSDGRDEYFAQAGKFIIEKDKASIGMLQRVFKIGFNRAARIMDQLADAGVVGEEEGTKPRKVLMTMEEFEEMNT